MQYILAWIHYGLSIKSKWHYLFQMVEKIVLSPLCKQLIRNTNIGNDSVAWNPRYETLCFSYHDRADALLPSSLVLAHAFKHIVHMDILWYMNMEFQLDYLFDLNDQFAFALRMGFNWSWIAVCSSNTIHTVDLLPRKQFFLLSYVIYLPTSIFYAIIGPHSNKSKSLNKYLIDITGIMLMAKY